MIAIKNKQAIRKMATAGLLLAEIFDQLPSQLQVGQTTAELDAWIARQIEQKDMISAMKGYMGYKHVSCISLNDVVVHGIPSKQVVLAEGDLVKVDVCASWRGYCADMARCFFVGEPTRPSRDLVGVAQQALERGIACARVGNRLSDISAAIEGAVEPYGYGIVRDFAGHGIGKRMHEDPEILNYGKPGHGPVLRPGMAFAIEPMITGGDFRVYTAEDGWTVRTVDRSLAAHVEDTVIVTDGEPLVVTRQN